MSLMNTITETGKGVFLAIQDTWRSYEYAKRHKFSTVLYEQDGEIHEFKATITPDGKWVSPKEINQQYKIKRQYRRFPQGDSVFICTRNNPETIDINLCDVELDDIKKGSILSAIAYDLFRTSIFKYMTAQSKREMVLLIMVFSLASLVFGILLGSSFTGG